MRAIILAAGMGTRLLPMTETMPKSLVKVNGQPILERQIEFLLEEGIDDILVVTGYLNEQLKYLVEKYDIKIIYNDKYDIYNNIYTMYLVRDYLSDAYVVEADVYFTKNIFDKNISKTSYFTGYKKGFDKEWIIDFDENDKVNDIIVRDGEGYIFAGVSYWKEDDGQYIARKLERAINEGDFQTLYWDDIIMENVKNINLSAHKIESTDWYEIDSLKDLENVENVLAAI